jgi:hypothetical protein
VRRMEVLDGVRMLKFRDVFGRCEQGRLSKLEAAELLGINERTFRRWCRRYANCLSRNELIGLLATRGSPFSRSGSEGREKRPGVPRPSRVEKRVVPGTQLVGQFRGARFDGPLFDVQTKLRIVEGQLIHASKQPTERDPVVSRKISPEYRVFVPVGKPANRIADFFPPHAFAVELGTHVQKCPLTCLGPIDLVALGIELAAVFGNQAHTDQINGVRPLASHKRSAISLTTAAYGGLRSTPDCRTRRTLGVDKHLADRARKAAAMTEKQFEAAVAAPSSSPLPRSKEPMR